jgi:hypothetical protein
VVQWEDKEEEEEEKETLPETGRSPCDGSLPCAKYRAHGKKVVCHVLQA